MFDNLSQRLQVHPQAPARRRPADRRQYPRGPARGAHGAARGRRGAAGGQGLHRATCAPAPSARRCWRASRPGQALIKVVHDELVALMGDERTSGSNLAVRPPAVVLVAGLQGAGKTTTVAKLARLLREREKKSRAAGERRRLPAGGHRAAAEAGARRSAPSFFPSRADQKPVDIARAARRSRRADSCCDVRDRRHRRPPARGRGDDGRDPRAARRARIRSRRCSWSTA